MITIQKRSLAEILAEKRAMAADKHEQSLLSVPLPEEKPLPLPLPPMVESISQSMAANGNAQPAKQQHASSVQPIQSISSLTNGIAAIRRMTLSEILAAKRNASQTIDNALIEDNLLPLPVIEEKKDETFSLDIVLNTNQILARDLCMTGQSFAYIGAAGTGKTTGLREIVRSLLQSNNLNDHDFKIQGTKDRWVGPSVAIIAWTRIASGNARRAIHKDPVLEQRLQYNITTAHNLLEFQPEFYYDNVSNKETMRFVPKRTAANKLDITHLIIEEASLIDLSIWGLLFEALRDNVQIIFVGDINQLGPVFGPSILNYALTQLPVVELTEVYRQSTDSLVLVNAHNILNGRTLVEGTGFKIIPCGDKQYGQERLADSLGVTFPKWQTAGMYDPDTDIILSPWNVKALGTDNINNWIAQRLGAERNAIVHQIRAGRTTRYLAVGDKIMYNKQIAYIKGINKNGFYLGTKCLEASTSLNRFGGYTGVHAETDDGNLELHGDYDNLDIDAMLEKDIDVSNQASHITTVETEDGIEYTLEKIGDYAASSFSLGYALTVHKAQGCEWKRVFLVLHKDHMVSLSRELLYTAVTRAREECIVIAKHSLIDKTIRTQRLKGVTLREKIEYFNQGLLNKDDVKCTK